MTAPAAPNATAVVTHLFPHAPEAVFDAWLDAGKIALWMFGHGDEDEKVLHIEADAKVGGRFSFLVERSGERIDHIGEYLKIDRPRSLSFTWGTAGADDSSKVDLELTPVENGCEVTLRHHLDPQWAAYVGSAARAWSSMLESLGESLAKPS